MTALWTSIGLISQRCGLVSAEYSSTASKVWTQSSRYFRTTNLKTQRWPRRNASESDTPLGALDNFFQPGPPRSPGSQLFKPFVFTVAFTSTSLTAAAVWQYENIRERTALKFHNSLQWYHDRRAQKDSIKEQIRRWWNSLSEGDKVFLPICAANILVFAAWRLPALQPVMVRYFSSNPASYATCLPMVLSTFSHYSALHIFANMYVLHSFAGGAVNIMGKEHFVGFYLTAAVVSSFASYLHKSILKKPGLSLGASGAIMGVLGYVCSQYPNLDLNIIFLPMITFKAAAALKVIMGIDALGVLLGWRFFDHAAHLGGVLFGVFWAEWGEDNIWKKRSKVVDVWHEIRGPP